MDRQAPQFPKDEQIQLMAEQIAGSTGSGSIPKKLSSRAIRDILARRMQGGPPLTVGEQMNAVVLLVDHTQGDMAFWEQMLGQPSLDVTARVTLLKALTYLAEMSRRPIHLTALRAVEMELLVEPRLMHDAIVHLTEGVFIEEVYGVLSQLPRHEQIQYWHQTERCRRRALLSAVLMWGPLLAEPSLAALRDLSLEAIDTEPGPVAALLLSQLVRSTGGTRAGVSIARRIAAMEGAPRRRGGLERLGITAFRVVDLDSGMERTGFSLAHPEKVWLAGNFDRGDGDRDLASFQIAVTPLPPRQNPGGLGGKVEVSPISGEELYDELFHRCHEAQREGVDIDYRPLLVLSMLEGTTPPGALSARMLLS